MNYVKPEIVSYDSTEIAEAIEASACGSVAGGCYGTSGCGCSYRPR